MDFAFCSLIRSLYSTHRLARLLLASKFIITAFRARGHFVVFPKGYFSVTIGTIVRAFAGLFAGLYNTI